MNELLNVAALVGLPASGKGSVAADTVCALKAQTGNEWKHISTSAVLGRTLERERGLQIGALENYDVKASYRDALTEMQSRLRTTDPAYLINCALEEPSHYKVIDSPRSTADFDRLIACGALFILISGAPEERRKAALTARDPDGWKKVGASCIEQELARNIPLLAARTNLLIEVSNESYVVEELRRRLHLEVYRFFCPYQQ